MEDIDELDKIATREQISFEINGMLNTMLNRCMITPSEFIKITQLRDQDEAIRNIITLVKSSSRPTTT